MPNTPEDNALLAQFAGQAMQALIQRDHAGNPITQDYVVRPAYDAAELMLQEHKRRTGAVAEAPGTPADPLIRLSTAMEVIRHALEIQKDPQALAAAQHFAEQLMDAMRRTSGDGQERGNG